MKANTTLAATLLAVCSIASTITHSQDTRSFNQNASRSNHTRMMTDDNWSFGLNTAASFAMKSEENTLFRGNSIATKMFGRYYFGSIGLGMSSGIVPGSISTNALNRFITERKFPQDQLQITKSKPFNSYFLAGPSFRFGNRVSINADLQGGLFVNNPGSVNISQTGVQRSLYRFEGGDKNIFPGFSGSIQIAYPINSSTRFFINTDYLQSRSSARVLDPQSGIDIATQLNRDLKLLTAGIGIVKSFAGRENSKRKKQIDNNGNAGRDASSGRPTGRRDAPAGNTAASSEQQSCGPVTQRITNADGTTEEITFACPADALAYRSQLAGNEVNPDPANAGKQTQGSSFGEKVNAGLHAAGSAISQGRSGHIVSGRVEWFSAGNTGGILTNQSVSSVSSVGSAGGGGAAAASYARQSGGSGSTTVNFYARDAASGRPSGRRDKGSGIATGRRQYEPVFADNSGTACNNCLANVKNNPLYNGSGTHGTNPMHEARQGNMQGQDSDGISGIDVALIETESGAVVSRTKTGINGDFFFANVPDGIYSIKLMGSVISRKGYDVKTNTTTDLLGTIDLNASPVQLFINTAREDNDAPVQKAGISTSRSNIRHSSLTIVEADLDGDGEYESLKATANFDDGGTAAIPAAASKSGGKKTIILQGEALALRRRVEVLKSNKQGADAGISSISISNNAGQLTATATLSDGRLQNVTEAVSINGLHNGIRQYTLVVADNDDDGMADAVVVKKSKSNLSNNKSANIIEEEEDLDQSVLRKMIPVTIPDISGAQKTVAAAFVPGAAASDMRRVGPIKGVIVKGGRNPGGDIGARATNENGEFEFTGLEAGDYTFSMEQSLLIEDETVIVLSTSRAQDHNSSRSNKTASSIAPDPGNEENSKRVQDHNSSRSNKTASGIAPEPGNEGNNTRAQDHNSSRSNKSSSIAAPDLGNGDAGAKKSNMGPVKWMAPEYLKSIVVEADLDGDGVYETDISGKVNDEVKINEKGEVIPQQKAGISTSRSNIRNRSSVQAAGNNLFIGYGTAELNNKTVPVKIIYKGGSGLKDTLKTQV